MPARGGYARRPGCRGNPALFLLCSCLELFGTLFCALNGTGEVLGLPFGQIQVSLATHGGAKADASGGF